MPQEMADDGDKMRCALSILPQRNPDRIFGEFFWPVRQNTGKRPAKMAETVARVVISAEPARECADLCPLFSPSGISSAGKALSQECREIFLARD